MAADIFVARQAIFDRQRRVYGYELLFRSSMKNVFSHPDIRAASVKMLDTTLLGFGLQPLVGDLPAFFNATREVLVEGHLEVLPPRQSVVEILETVEPDDVVVDVCRAAKRAGYRFALDDFVFRPGYERLIELADFIKVDFLITKGDERAAVVRRFARPDLRFLAEKVETQEDFRDGERSGYDLFQGYFFCKPEMVSGRDIPAYKSNCIRFLADLHQPELDFDRLARIIEQEVALSVKLLRYLNSAGFGWRHPVGTIGQAIRVLGERQLKRWASLVAVTMMGEDKPQELVVTSLVRAELCDHIARASGPEGSGSDPFLVGLLSTVDALLDQPLELVVDQLPLADDIKHGLTDSTSPLGQVLDLARSYDHADWARITLLANQVGITETSLPGFYRDAVRRVNQVFQP